MWGAGVSRAARRLLNVVSQSRLCDPNSTRSCCAMTWTCRTRCLKDRSRPRSKRSWLHTTCWMRCRPVRRAWSGRSSSRCGLRFLLAFPVWGRRQEAKHAWEASGSSDGVVCRRADRSFGGQRPPHRPLRMGPARIDHDPRRIRAHSRGRRRYASTSEDNPAAVRRANHRQPGGAGRGRRLAGVGGEFVPEIAHAIHEQVGVYRRKLYSFLDGDESALDGGACRATSQRSALCNGPGYRTSRWGRGRSN